MDFVDIVYRFLTDMYNSGGAKVRWVDWIWAAFVFLYLIIGKYERIHAGPLLAKRTEYKRNYFLTLHAWGIAAIFFQYGHDLFQLPVKVPITVRFVGQITTAGFVILIIGFWFVVWGRLYLNGFWGTHIYQYADAEIKNQYKLVTDKPYRACRHPIYFGQSFMVLGTGLVFNNWFHIGLAALLIAVNVVRAKKEEKFLEETFPTEWKKYKNKTPFIFPYIF